MEKKNNDRLIDHHARCMHSMHECKNNDSMNVVATKASSTSMDLKF